MVGQLQTTAFIKTVSRTYTTGNIHYGVFVNNASGSGYTITGNSIGGTAPLCAGTPMTMGGTIATRFFGVNLNLASGGLNSLVQNNTVSNINLTTFTTKQLRGSCRNSYFRNRRICYY